jgi:hypothetical protein
MEHGSEIAYRAIEEETRVGMLGLQDGWARMLARKFVRMTRFDPLHQAATEQVLYIQLPDHLAALDQRDSTPVTISSGGRRHTVDLERREVIRTASEAYELLASWIRRRSTDGETTLLLGDRIAALPGLAAHLSESTDPEIVVLHPAAAGSAVLHHADRIRSLESALPLVSRLPGYDARPPGPVTIAVTPPTRATVEIDAPTHVVVDGVAHPITEDAFPLSLETAAGDGIEAVTVRRYRDRAVIEFPSGAEVLLNGEVLDGGAALTTGDRLRIGSSTDEILLVTMAE